MRALAILLMLGFGSKASATDCSRALADGRKVARMNAALTPALRDLGRRMRALSDDEIRRRVAALAMDPTEQVLVDQLGPLERALGVYGSYEGWFKVSPHPILRGPFTRHNRRAMFRLTRAATLAHVLIAEWAEDIRAHPAIQAELELLRTESATGEDVVFLLQLACETVLQGVSAFTASRVPGLEAEEILERVTRMEDGRPSLINQYALALTAGQLGSNGDLVFLVDPLSYDGRALRVCPKCRALMKSARARFDRSTASVGEFGRGCPVAHTLNGFARTGVQEFVDGVMHFYGALE